jgi:holo-[acyl-carrier protein] synthase
MLTAGIDLVEVERIEGAIARFGERFLARVFTVGELEYCRGRPLELAARFAAKEAASKALGVGVQHHEGVCWREIEVISDVRGKPSLKLAGRAAQRAEGIGVRSFALSLSHTHEYAIALVIAE